MATLGNRIALYRKQNNYTQEELASKLNVSSQAVSKWENDLSIPDISLLIDLANLFNVTLDTLVKGDNAPTTYYVPEKQRKSVDELVLRINVLSSDGDKVKVNLPILDTLVKGDNAPTTYYVPEKQRKSVDELVLRINVLSSDGDKVKVNLPIAAVKLLLASSLPFMASKNGEDIMKNIDFEYIFQLVDKGVFGTLVELESEDGDLITISVE